MKLRNKKTGEIVDFQPFRFYQTDSCKFPSEIYESLSALNEEWEDYTPKGPLIKDKKIRAIIRQWAKVNGTTELKYDLDENSLTDLYRNTISFNRVLDLKDEYTYTITELCGV